jgi:hypothetical protein
MGWKRGFLRVSFGLSASGATIRPSRAGLATCILAGALLVICPLGLRPASAQAQPAGGIVADGNAVVTGFSGLQLPTLIAPGTDPAARTTIDLNGPALRAIDLQAPGGAPQAQVLTAAKPFTVTAGQIGQVFALALDNASPPNVYAAATSVYGLPIVVPDADGDGRPDRAEQGVANARFMAGLFGPAAQQGGPGSIWRIDGQTGEVRLFANVTFEGAPNGGAALGGLAFDPASRTLFVADRETGMIHRFDLTGAERGRYDHGTQGRPAGGLAPAPFNPSTRLVITRPPFQPADPETWGYAPRERRVFGLAARDGRLYYAVAESLQVWSVAIAPDGAFGSDARIETAVSPGQSASEISKIAFDDQGRMLLAERVAPSGAFNFVALTEEGGGRVLRFAPAPPGAGPAWQSDAEEYTTGFAAQLRGNGGVAVGYGYDASGALDRNACSGFVWATGEQLRVSTDATLASQLAQGGPAAVNGLQGIGIELVRAAGAPPLQGYFVDFDDRFDDANARGQIGDVAVFRACARVAVAEALPAPGEPAFPGVPAGPGLPIDQIPGPPDGGGIDGGVKVGAPDLALSKAILAGPAVAPGVAVPNACVPTAPCWFRITVTNNGPGPFNGPLNVTDTMPAGWTFVSAAAPWACQGAGAAVACTRPAMTLAQGQSTTLDIRLQAPAPAGGQPVFVDNCAQIDWKGGAGDANKANDHACHKLVLTVAPAVAGNFDLTIAKKGPAKCVAGQPCNFNVTVQNLGTGNYQGVLSVEDVSTPGLTFSGSPTTHWTCVTAAAGTVKCNYGQASIPSGAGSTLPMLILNFTVPANLPPGTTQIKNCAKVVYSGTSAVNAQPDEHCIVVAVEPPPGTGQQAGPQQPGDVATLAPGTPGTEGTPGTPGGPLTGAGGVAGVLGAGETAQDFNIKFSGISISKKGPDSGACEPGKTCDFTVTIKGTTAAPYTSVFEVADVPPPGWTFDAANTGKNWTCPSPTNCTYDITKHSQWPNISKSGFTATGTWLQTNIAFKVPDNAKEGLIENCVTATLPPSPGTNDKTIMVGCAKVWIGHAPNITFNKEYETSSCGLGGQCNFTITIRNEGKGAYTGFIDLGDLITPAAAAVINKVSSTDWNCQIVSQELVRCFKDSLKAGATTTIKVEATVRKDVAFTPFNEFSNCVSIGTYGTDPGKLDEGDKLQLVRNLLEHTGFKTAGAFYAPLSEAEKKALADYKSKNAVKDDKGNPDTSGDITDALLKTLLPRVANASGTNLGKCFPIKVKEPGLTIRKVMVRSADVPADVPTTGPKAAKCAVGDVCVWEIEVYGTEAAPYTKPIKIEENLPNGFQLVDYKPKGPGGWSCSGSPYKLICTHAPANVTNNASLKLTISARITWQDMYALQPEVRHPWITNCAKIVYDDPKKYQEQKEPDKPWQACDKERIPSSWDIQNYDYDATGSGPCLPPKCSFYEFTITGRGRSNVGPLTQRITPPPGSAFPQARVTKAPALCPASGWSCSKSGDSFTCRTTKCALAAGEQVTVRLEGSVAPDLKEPPPAPIDKTACGVLEYETGAFDTGIEQLTDKRTKQACATITVLARPPACAPGYAKTADGQCCLASQMTTQGVCCLPGTRPDSRRRTCVAVTPETPVVAPPPAIPQCTGGKVLVDNRCVCPPGTTERRGACVRVPATPRCTGGKVLVDNRCICPPGTTERRGLCVRVPATPQCTGGKVLVGNRCICPPGTREQRGQCVQVPVTPQCTGGKVLVGNRCVCPPGTTERRGQCVRLPPPPPQCTGGKVLVGNRCVCPPGTTEMRGLCVRQTPPPQIQQMQRQLAPAQPR